jgi:DNA-binding XRE family transcriptional regulator
MLLDSSHSVKMSSFHEMAVDLGQDVLFHSPMAESNKSLAQRLKMTREALEITPAQLCRRLGIAENRWSQYENGKRRITMPVAIRLCDEFGLTLDWIYRGNPAHLPNSIRLKMPAKAA